MTQTPFRIFVSSPGDVGEERVIAVRVITRLAGEFGQFLTIQPVVWEHEPLRATGHFQDQITRPSDTDIVVCILWSRLGTRLPEQFRRADGSLFSSGTEWEFEDAASAFRTRGAPDLLVYRKTQEATASLTDADAVLRKLEQKKALDAFITHWFGSAEDSFRAAFHNFADADEFERVLEMHLRRVLQDRLPKNINSDSAGSTVTWHRGSPFRGLEAFDVDDAPIFFGRTRAIAELKAALVAQALRGTAFVTVFGMSGSGKSSLVRAGLLSTMAQPGVVEGVGLWRWAILRPSDGADPVDVLATALLSDTALPRMKQSGIDHAALSKLLREAPQQAAFPIRVGLAEESRDSGLREDSAARLALVVDQLEELFTLPTLVPAARTAFVSAIDALARSGLVYVVATMRSDLYHRAAEEPQLVSLMEGAGHYHLLPPSAAEIAQIVRQPARAAGLRFEIAADSNERLDDVLLAAIGQDPAALPLLEFTLEELFAHRSPDRVLTFAAYRELGGLGGSLARRAEEVFAQLPPDTGQEAPAVFRGLVTIGPREDEPPTARRVPMAAIATTPRRQAIVDAMIGARLLVADRADDGTAVIRIAHEALLKHWPRLNGWLAADREFLRIREQVAQAASRWQGEGRMDDLLLPEGRSLLQGETLLPRRNEIDPVIVEFVEASKAARKARQKYERRRQRRRLQYAIGSAVVFAFISLFALSTLFYADYLEGIAITEGRAREAAAQRAIVERDNALINQSRFLGAQARDLADSGDTELALLIALEALPRDLQQPNRPLIPEAMTALHYAFSLHRDGPILRSAARSLQNGAFTRDGTKFVATGINGVAIAWDVASTRTAFYLVGLENEAISLASSADGRWIATGSRDKTARLWRAENGEPGPVFPHEREVSALAFDPTSKTLATGTWGGAIRLTDIASGEVRRELARDIGLVDSVAFSPDGGLLAAAARDRFAMWNTRTGEPVATRAIDSPRTPVFSPDGQWLAVGTLAGIVHVLRAPDWTEAFTLRGHQGWITSLRYSPQGDRLISASEDGTARLWSAANGNPIAVLAGHRSAVQDTTFDGTGEMIATASIDGTAHLWDGRTGRSIASLRGHTAGVEAVAFDPKGRWLATVSSDDTARLWDLNVGMGRLLWHAKPGVSTVFDDDVRGFAFTKDGGRLITVGRYAGIKSWDPRSGAALGAFELADALVESDGVALSPELDRIALLFGRSSVGVFRVADGTAVFETNLPRTDDPFDDLAALAFSPSGSALAVAGRQHTLRMLDAATGKLLWEVDTGSAWNQQVLFAKGGRTLLTAGVNGVREWDAATGAAIRTLSSRPASRMAMNKDGKILLVAANSASVAHLIDLVEGKEVAALRGHVGGSLTDLSSGGSRILSSGSGEIRAIAISPTGDRVATAAGDGTARLWDVESGIEVATLRHRSPYVSVVAFSPDGTSLLTAADNEAILWDVESGTAFAVLRGHSKAIDGAVFSEDGGTVATKSADGSVRLWPATFVSGEDFIDLVRATLVRELTEDEKDRFYLPKTPPHPNTPAEFRANDPILACDTLAADPFDTQRTEVGVARAVMLAEEARLACAAGIAAQPELARLHHQLARALAKLGEPEAAIAHYKTAAEGRHVIGMVDYAQALKARPDDAGAAESAQRWLELAAETGAASGLWALGRHLLYDTPAPGNVDRGLDLIETAIRQRYAPAFQSFLEITFESAEGEWELRTVENLFFGTAVAEALFQQAGDPENARLMGEKRATLAKLLPMASVIATYRNAASQLAAEAQRR